MNKPLFLFVGKSSSGKTTVADQLEKKYGMKQVYSYCTREPRYDGEIGHIFVSEEEFHNLGELAAYTYYNGHHYGTTFEQLDKCNIYVIDVDGVRTLLDKCEHYSRSICILYFDSTVYNRINRMQNRGDSNEKIISRLLQDEQDDWYNQLNSLVWHYANNKHMNVELHPVDANRTMSDVISQIMYYVNKYEEE